MAGMSSRQWIRQVRRDWTAGAHSWERREPQLLHSLAAVDSFLVRALDLRPGHRLLDFGCGSGEPTLAFAPLVAPATVLGLDISPTMLAIARRRARLRGIRNVRFRRGDIARARLRGRFDRAVSRYGLMFVDDVPLTLEHLRKSLKPGGRVAFAVWGPIERNALFAARAWAAGPFVKESPPDPEQSPGPLRLARPGLLPRLMRHAGFRQVHTLGVHAPITYRDVDEYVESNFCTPGPLKDLHDSLTRRQRAQLRRRVERALRSYSGGILLRLPGFAWVVSGRR